MNFTKSKKAPSHPQQRPALLLLLILLPTRQDKSVPLRTSVPSGTLGISHTLLHKLSCQSSQDVAFPHDDVLHVIILHTPSACSERVTSLAPNTIADCAKHARCHKALPLYFLLLHTAVIGVVHHQLVASLQPCTYCTGLAHMAVTPLMLTSQKLPLLLYCCSPRTQCRCTWSTSLLHQCPRLA